MFCSSRALALMSLYYARVNKTYVQLFPMPRSYHLKHPPQDQRLVLRLDSTSASYHKYVT